MPQEATVGPMRRKIAVSTFIMLFCATGLLLGARNTPEDELMKADKDFAAATQKHGIDGWVSFFAENGSMLRERPITGKEPIRTAMGPFLSTKGLNFTWAPTHAEVLPAGDTGYTVGRYSITLPDKHGKATTQTGSYITIWKKQQDGSWKVLADTGSPDPPKPKS